MTDIFSALIFILLVELACVAIHKRGVRATRVSDVQGTDHTLLPISKILVLAVGGGTACLVIVAASLDQGFWSLIATLLVYLLIRISIALQDVSYARKTKSLRLLEALSAPETATARFAFFFSGPHMLDPYHVTMWLEPLTSLGHKFVVVVAEQKHLANIPPSEAYHRISFAGLSINQRVLPLSCRAVFYANNSMTNIDVIRRNPSLEHIQLLHGDSDKPPSFNPVAKAYSRLFVAGKMAIDRYARNGVQVSDDLFVVVGRPQLKPFETTKKDATTVVYMTTWAGNFEDTNFSSFTQAIDILRAASECDGVDEVIFKPHPVSYKDSNWETVRQRFSELAKNSKIQIRWAEHDESPFELYAKADVLISDISSTIIDYLYAGKPYIVTNPQGFSNEELKKYPSVAGGYLCEQDVGNVGKLLRLALSEDPVAETREEVRQYAFGDLNRPIGAAFREACWEIIGKPVE
ncbi:hypothetical protein EOK75_06930 [Pseudorhodobacter turbinis]|uniref:CDP-glycerol--glycerophosphate glycerophosphotransferase n=1 Tax=Pseudorhodobacter turbinis TaxID=2500533 RepID=A0A4P8EF74_9RHOB|nr:CDP-glycerol glycerophosphotransferase family protein [Pseudorhodobacter turbinis]QCO55506.1 hypothetical protein EOK75_06930 [Pseudorhodobacter turbinis]